MVQPGGCSTSGGSRIHRSAASASVDVNIRYPKKLIDELAKIKPLEKVRQPLGHRLRSLRPSSFRFPLEGNVEAWLTLWPFDRVA